MQNNPFWFAFFNFFLVLDIAAHDRQHHHCPDTHQQWDYIIVGDGTAGAVIAAELANNRKNSVLVLEWGQNHTEDPVVLSPNPLQFSNLLTYDPAYAITPISPVAFPNQRVEYFIYSDGRLWGGGSAHNGMFAVRGTPTLYNLWAASTGNNRWTYNNLLPLMKGMESYHPDDTFANPEQRGLFGPVGITQSPPVNQDPFAQAVASGTNTPLVSDYNDPNEGNIGISAHQQFITPPPFSHRTFSANTYQKTGVDVNEEGVGLHGRKLLIQSNALVDRVIFRGKKAAGVEYWMGGKPSDVKRVYARKKVILCAGTLQSSAILERSGIGDRARLESLGINVVVDNPNVGEHLENHYGPSGLIRGFTSATPFFNGFINLSPYMPDDDVRRMQLIGLNVTVAGVEAVSLSGILLQSKSRGSSHIVDRNPSIYPRLDLNMYSDGPVDQPGTDAYESVSFLKLLQTIAADYGSVVLSPPPEAYQNDQTLLAYTENLANLTVTYHLVGSARMAPSAEGGVVDGDLHVFGVENLMVADCSIEPFIEDGNTAYSAFIIGLEALDILRGH